MWASSSLWKGRAADVKELKVLMRCGDKVSVKVLK